MVPREERDVTFWDDEFARDLLASGFGLYGTRLRG